MSRIRPLGIHPLGDQIKGKPGIHPLGDQIKVKLDDPDPHGFSGGESQSVENGIAVEMTDSLGWLGFHSFAFENSFANPEALAQVYDYYQKFLNQRVYWESYQDSGRRLKEGGNEYVFIKLTDIIAYSDPDVNAKTVSDVRRSGSFKA